MLDFRKTILALAILAITSVSAFAQIPAPLSCTAQAAGTPSIRSEGVTELVGDVLIQCTGGTPTPLGQSLKQVNIQVFTQPAVNITSRILSSATLNNFTEALLIMDDPTTDKQTLCGGDTFPNSVPSDQPFQQIIGGVCGQISGTGTGANTYDPSIASPAIANTAAYASAGNGLTCSGTPSFCASARGNAFQARSASNTSLIWQGVPFDPPGTSGVRTMRLTNIRINASQLGVPAGSTANVQLLISTSASGVQNPIAVPITNPQPVVALAQNSLRFTVEGTRTGGDSCLQCENANSDFTGDSTKTLTTPGTKCDGSRMTLRFEEIFPSVLRRRSNAQPSPTTTGTIPPTPTSQDVLGVIYQSESGFYKAASNGSRWPTQLAANSSINNTSVVSGINSGTLGLADHGTRLIVRFANVQNGLALWVGTTGAVFTPQGNASPRTGTVTLVTTDPNGSGPFSATPAGTSTNGGMAQVSVIGGTGQATWEVVNADTTAVERVDIPLVVAYKANTAANLPSLGTATGNGGLGPISTVATASTTAPLPRFVDSGISRNVLTINSCRTNILFPFVSNQAGFDTGLAIANTSKDPFGTQVQTGACTVNFYGTIANAKVCLSYPSPSITGGEHFVWALSSGGAVNPTAGFQGYVIAQCQFQFGHGFAFISDLGAQRLAMGYLALVMDAAIASRTGSVSETLGH